MVAPVGLAHLYQGWLGVAATFVAGLQLATLYQATGSLFAAIAAHVALDLFGLVVRPTLAQMRPRR
ncbi:MAG TPA: CPBP family intramembrane glutamic endopeptidase [Caulobacteraceae bacterium]